MEVKDKLFNYINAHLSEEEKLIFKNAGMQAVESLLEIVARFVEEKHYQGLNIIHYSPDEDIDILKLLKEDEE